MGNVFNFERFVNESDQATSFSLADFKRAFQREYSHMSLELSDRDIQEFLNQSHVKGKTMKVALDLFSDYLLANGLADVQEKITENSNTQEKMNRLRHRQRQEMVDEILDKIYLIGTKENGKYMLTLKQATEVAEEIFETMIKPLQK